MARAASPRLFMPMRTSSNAMMTRNTDLNISLAFIVAGTLKNVRAVVNPLCAFQSARMTATAAGVVDLAGTSQGNIKDGAESVPMMLFVLAAEQAKSSNAKSAKREGGWLRNADYERLQGAEVWNIRVSTDMQCNGNKTRNACVVTVSQGLIVAGGHTKSTRTVPPDGDGHFDRYV